MNALITPDVIESYFHCRRKAYLKAAGESGVTHDFESHQNEIASAIKQAINDRIAVKNAPTDVRHRVAMTPTVLRSGVLYILDATLRTPEFHLTFDGLRFIPRDSSNAKAHYIPISYFPQRNLRKEQKLLLASYALILGEAQECNVNSGLVFFGPDFRSTSLRLQKLLPDATRALRELRQLLEASDPPPVLINNHCAVCEYRKQCNEQAIRDDNISLLRGLGEKEIKAHSRKGILTITQLAHTFRRRRKGNRAGLVKRRYHALQAMAIRDGATYEVDPIGWTANGVE